MKWEDFYEKYDEWAESTILNKISSLTDFGDVDEILEVCQTYDEKIAVKLLKKALVSDVKFTPQSIIELDGCVPTDMLDTLTMQLISDGANFTFDDIIELDGVVNSDCLDGMVKAAKKNGVIFNPEQIEELEYIITDKSIVAGLTEDTISNGDVYSAEQLIDVADSVNEETLEKLIEKSLANGVHFDLPQIEELDGYISYELMNKLMRKADLSNNRSLKDLLDYEYYMDDETRLDMVKRIIRAGEEYTPADILECEPVLAEEEVALLTRNLANKGTVFSLDELITLAVFVDTDCVDAILKNNLKNKDVYTIEQLWELDGIASVKMLTEAVKRIKRRLTVEEIHSLNGLISDSYLLQRDRKDGTNCLLENQPRPRRSGGIGWALFFGALIGLHDGVSKTFESSYTSGKFQVGDHVTVKYRGQEGWIIDKNGPLYMVSMHNGARVDSYYEEQLTDTGKR